ncbi:unnamed protein product [Victoria cruziana]
MGERWGLNPCVVDSQSTALGPGKASNKKVGLFIDLTSLYLRLKLQAGQAVIKALATCNRLKEHHREDHQQIMHCSTHHLLGCHRPGDNQYEAVASPSIEVHHHISDDRISKSRIKIRNGWKSLSNGARTIVD